MEEEWRPAIGKGYVLFLYMSLVKICISFLTCRVERVNSVQEVLKQVDLLHYYPILVEHEIDMAALRQERENRQDMSSLFVLSDWWAGRSLLILTSEY
jgi:hypothetical protein